jgi:hypothetical protein
MFAVLHIFFYVLVSFVWRDIEINLYGTSQPSIVDACAALYVAYRIACWVTEEVTDQ